MYNSIAIKVMWLSLLSFCDITKLNGCLNIIVIQFFFSVTSATKRVNFLLPNVWSISKITAHCLIENNFMVCRNLVPRARFSFGQHHERGPLARSDLKSANRGLPVTLRRISNRNKMAEKSATDWK